MEGDHSRLHSNNIGLIRLILACTVIVGHVYMVKQPGGDPLERHGLPALSWIAVDLFFLISGWLITASWFRDPSLPRFLIRRICRIYPAFIIAFFVSAFIGAELVGLLDYHFAIAVLLPPYAPTLADGRSANISIWTIAYEFRCYLLIALLGGIGVLKHRRAASCALATIVLSYWTVNAAGLVDWLQTIEPSNAAFLFFGSWADNLRLGSFFAAGSIAYLNRERLHEISTPALFAGAGGAMLLLPIPRLAEVGVLLSGGPLTYFLAFRAKLGPLQTINNRDDVSYATYLYGWPVELIIFAAFPNSAIGALMLLTILGSLGAGSLSWLWLERHVLALGHRLTALDGLPVGRQMRRSRTNASTNGAPN